MPPWVPHIINVNGIWEQVLNLLYRIFENDFINVTLNYEGRQVKWDNRKLDGKYDEGFWHLITNTDNYTGERIPDYRRAERLPWCGPIISNSGDSCLKVWDYCESNGRIRTYLWLENWDYVVVLEKRSTTTKEVAILITAYYIEGSSTRNKFLGKYNNRII
jgi:hypothetical protein